MTLTFNLLLTEVVQYLATFFLEDDVVFAKFFHSIVVFRASSVPLYD